MKNSVPHHEISSTANAVLEMLHAIIGLCPLLKDPTYQGGIEIDQVRVALIIACSPTKVAAAMKLDIEREAIDHRLYHLASADGSAVMRAFLLAHHPEIVCPLVQQYGAAAWPYFGRFLEGLKGTILRQSCRIKQLTEMLHDLRGRTRKAKLEPPTTILNMPLKLFFPRTSAGSRARNCLTNIGCETVGDMLGMNWRQLQELPDFGEGCLELTSKLLQEHGLELAG